MRAMLSAVLMAAVLPAYAADEEVKLSKIKYEELGKFVASQKGKVVVVDFWATYCVPCKEGFPHLVQMHQQLKDKGVVVVSVSVDMLDDEVTLEYVKKTLATFKMTMTNFLLDEPAEKWVQKLNSKGVPVVYVFNKAGQIEAKFTEGKKDKQLDEAVERALKEKAP